MLDFAELEKQLGNLEKGFLNVMLFNLMKKGKLDYIELSKQCVRYLESEKEDNSKLITDLGYSLMHHRHPDAVGGKTKEEKFKFINEKAISALKRTGLFPTELDYMNGVAKYLKP